MHPEPDSVEWHRRNLVNVRRTRGDLMEQKVLLEARIRRIDHEIEVRQRQIDRALREGRDKFNAERYKA